MANTINDLFRKYVNKVERGLENDRYFQYLYEMVAAGDNTISQKKQIMHKVVDERWIEIIEESLDSINNIIDKPRRFIATSEEVVPVALAKKITADSVMHLSMNTQFIDQDDNGNIMPSKVLNVTTEESYDLYENRFIYHLIQRLVAFIDKRTDVIFWQTGDEQHSTMQMQSKVEDAYEEIEYKIEMTIRNRQSYAENESDNMSVFMRIDRVRRMIMSLRDSSFCSIMAGCAKVYSPIQRTNLMMKDRDYRTCYKLWQFLESYDEVGYSIEPIDSTIEFDEEYLIQLYTNLITNYAVFKSLLEDDRNILENNGKKRKIIKPKFIKNVKEEIVTDYDIPDVEIRKVLIEEVTQAQLDAEEQLEIEKKRYAELVEYQNSLDEQIHMLNQQINIADEQRAEANRQAFDDRKAREEAEEKAKEATAAKDEALAMREGLEKAVLDTKREAEETYEKLRSGNAARLEKLTKEYENQIKTLNQKSKAELLKLAKDADKAVADKEKEGKLLAGQIQKESEKELRRVTNECARKQNQADKKISDLNLKIEELKAELQNAKAEYADAITAEKNARKEAEDKLESMRLNRLLGDMLSNSRRALEEKLREEIRKEIRKEIAEEMKNENN